MRLSCCEVRVHLNYRKNDRWPSHRFYSALQRQKSLMRLHLRDFRLCDFRVFQYNLPRATWGDFNDEHQDAFEQTYLPSNYRLGSNPDVLLGAARRLPPSADIGPGGQSVGQAAQFCLG